MRLILLCIALVACKEDSKSSDKGKSESSAKGPADIDIEALTDKLKCKKSDDRKGCECLRDFEKAKAFEGMPEDGQDNWVGYTYALGGTDDGKQQYFFGHFADGKGDVRALFPENDDEEADAKKLVKAVSGGGKAPKDSEAAKFIKGHKPDNGLQKVAKTKGASLKLEVDELFAYVRADGDRLLVVEASQQGELQMTFKDQKLKARALCSELWKMK